MLPKKQEILREIDKLENEQNKIEQELEKTLERCRTLRKQQEEIKKEIGKNLHP